MMNNRHGHLLDDWITATAALDAPHIAGFATGLHRDHAAVTNGLTLPYSSGVVEGTVNKIKFLKRQMFGRANLDLLRIRVLQCRLGVDKRAEDAHACLSAQSSAA